MIEATDLNRRAFPVPHDQYNPITPGMTLREWYAGLALQGMLANNDMIKAVARVAERREMVVAETLVKTALAYADALLAELAKGGDS